METSTIFRPASIKEEDYTQETFRIAAGLPSGAFHKLPVVPSFLQRLFVRAEEYERNDRDQWGNWEFAYSENYKSGKLWVPECDLWLQEQRRHLLLQGERLEPLWPKGHAFAVCLTHDVDHIAGTMTIRQRGRELLRTLRARDLHPIRRVAGAAKSAAKMLLRHSTPEPHTRDTLDACYLIEKEFGVTASYFFTVPLAGAVSKYDCLYSPSDRCTFLGKARTVRDVMAFLRQEGHDVGLHGSYFSAVRPGLLAKQRRILEKAIQAPVATTRQHWLHLHLPKTLNLQEKAGFLADTTLGFNRNIGFRAGTSLPFHPYDREEKRQLTLIEAPLIIQDGALIGSNALEYSTHTALEVVKEFVSRIKSVNGCLTFLFHPDIFMKPGLAPLYRSIIDHCLSENGWVTDLNSLQAWWREREAKLS